MSDDEEREDRQVKDEEQDETPQEPEESRDQEASEVLEADETEETEAESSPLTGEQGPEEDLEARLARMEVEKQELLAGGDDLDELSGDDLADMRAAIFENVQEESPGAVTEAEDAATELAEAGIVGDASEESGEEGGEAAAGEEEGIDEDFDAELQAEFESAQESEELQKKLEAELAKRKEQEKEKGEEVMTTEKLVAYFRDRRDKVWYHALTFLAFEVSDHTLSKEALYDQLKGVCSSSAIDPIQENVFYFGLSPLMHLKLYDNYVVRYRGGAFRVAVNVENLQEMLQEAGEPISRRPVIEKEEEMDMIKDFLGDDFGDI